MLYHLHKRKQRCSTLQNETKRQMILKIVRRLQIFWWQNLSCTLNVWREARARAVISRLPLHTPLILVSPSTKDQGEPRH